MEITTLPMNAIRGTYLGSKDRILVGGNAPCGIMQILYSQQNDHKHLFRSVTDQHLKGLCTDFELCGIPRLAKTVIAVALNDVSNASSSIELFDIESAPYEANLMDMQSNLMLRENASISAISFCSELELLAVGNEAGFIVIFDLYSGREVSRLKADPCGINKVKFIRTGQLVTVGDSSNSSQIKIWDMKVGGGEKVQPAMVLSQQLTHFDAKIHYSSNCECHSTRFSSIASHPMKEKIVTGCADTGAVLLWDLRSESSIKFSPHQINSTVTDVMIHPRRHDAVLSASTDGTVRYFDSSLAPMASNDASPPFNLIQKQCQQQHYQDNCYPILLSEPAATSPIAGSINSLDCNADTCTLLAVTSTGNMMQIQI